MNKKLDALLDTLEDVKNPKEKVSVIHAAFEDNSRIVAVVEVDKTLSIEEKLDIAFLKTNSINEAGWNNTEVTVMFPDKSCRSTSTGDMVLIGKVKYKCEAVGWSVV